MGLKTTLPLSAASTIVDNALDAARRSDLAPLTIAVLDAGGHLVALKREDGCGILRVEIATGKAWGALGMGLSGRAIRDKFSEVSNFVTALTAASVGRFIPVPGSVLVLDAEGDVIGAVGVSGDSSQEDERVAIAGVVAAGLTPEPQA